MDIFSPSINGKSGLLWSKVVVSTLNFGSRFDKNSQNHCAELMILPAINRPTGMPVLPRRNLLIPYPAPSSATRSNRPKANLFIISEIFIA